jgi:hypothetical protein
MKSRFIILLPDQRNIFDVDIVAVFSAIERQPASDIGLCAFDLRNRPIFPSLLKRRYLADRKRLSRIPIRQLSRKSFFRHFVINRSEYFAWPVMVAAPFTPGLVQTAMEESPSATPLVNPVTSTLLMS